MSVLRNREIHEDLSNGNFLRKHLTKKEQIQAVEKRMLFS